MSATITVKATKRTDIGKGASRRLRHANNVPAIIYGDNKEPALIVIESRIVKRVLEEEAFYSQIIKLDVDGEAQDVILKALQRHPATTDALHLDFLRISANQAITTSIPLHFINEENCVGVKSGGILTHNLTEVEIRCLPDALPEFIEIDVSNLETNHTIHLSDISISENVEITQLRFGESHDLAVVTVKPPRKESEAPSENEAKAEDSTEDKQEDKS